MELGPEPVSGPVKWTSTPFLLSGRDLDAIEGPQSGRSEPFDFEHFPQSAKAQSATHGLSSELRPGNCHDFVKKLPCFVNLDFNDIHGICG